MSIDAYDAEQWTAEQLLAEYERREETMKQLVGTLYRGILADEMETIGKVCMARWGHHPNWLIDRGLVLASWTCPDGIVHDWRGRMSCRIGMANPLRGRDKPTQTITCIECIGTFG